MELVVVILIFLHLMGLVIGMGSGIALSVLGPLHGTATEDQRSLMFNIGARFARNGHVGLALLWITGPLILWLRYGGIGGLSSWFWVKIALVIALSASIGMGSAAYRKFSAGDTGASARVALTGKINGIVGILVVLTAVLAFA